MKHYKEVKGFGKDFDQSMEKYFLVTTITIGGDTP